VGNPNVFRAGGLRPAPGVSKIIYNLPTRA
jgi:hypothetical protein